MLWVQKYTSILPEGEDIEQVDNRMSDEGCRCEELVRGSQGEVCYAGELRNGHEE